MVTIGRRIADARKAKGLTQPQLAELCGWGDDKQARISHYETGRRDVSIEDAVIIASALETNIVKLLGPHLLSATSADTVDDLLEQIHGSGDIRQLLAALPYIEKLDIINVLKDGLSAQDAMELARELIKHAQDGL